MSGSARIRPVIATVGFLLIAAFFLTTEHRAHLFGILPFLLILACLLLHVFMHGGHGSHDSPRDSAEPSTGGAPSGLGARREDVR